MRRLFNFINHLYLVLESMSWLPPLLARLSLAGVFIESGWGKLHNIPKVVEFFTSLGIPAPEFQAHLVAATEFCCGILLLFGFLTRLASLPLLVIMIVAVGTAKGSELHGVLDLFGLPEYLYIVVFVYLIIDGAGTISLDHLILKRFGKK